MALEKVCGIYKITSPSGSFYIGSSVNVAKRLHGHRSSLRKGKHHSPPLQNAANKYGIDNLIFEPVCECPPEHVRELEQLLIDEFNPQYNASKCVREALSDLWKDPSFRAKGVERSREQAKRWRQDPEWVANQKAGARRSLGERMRNKEYMDNHVQKYSLTNLEKANTPDGKAKAAEARRKRFKEDPDIHRRVGESQKANNIAAILAGTPRARGYKPVVCIETGVVYGGIMDAVTKVKMSVGALYGALKDAQKKAGKLHWRYATLEESQAYYRALMDGQGG